MLDLLHKVLFSLISGFSEFIFVSAPAHRLLYQTITGYQTTDNLLMLIIHLGCLFALLSSCGKLIKRLRYEKRLARPGRRRRSRNPDVALLNDMRIINVAVVPILLSFLVYPQVSKWGNNLALMALFLLLFSLFLFIPGFMRSGNKDGRTYALSDGLLMGLTGCLGNVTGFGRLGCMFSVARMRGAGAQYALDLSLLICIPSVILTAFFDIYGITQTSIQISALDVVGYILSAVAAFFSAKLAIGFVRRICDQRNLNSFAYFNFGLSFFVFLIYLIIP